MSERRELLNLLKVMWRKGDSSLRRIYPSWDDLEANMDIMIDKHRKKEKYIDRSCPNCGAIQKIAKPTNELFPYETCQSCKHPFHVNKDCKLRRLTEDEEDNMPAEWVRILEDLQKKKLAIVFRLE